MIRALQELGFDLTPRDKQELRSGKDFIQFPNGPFPLDIVHAPDGIESFEEAWTRGSLVENIPVIGLEDVLASKRAANRDKDRLALIYLEPFARDMRARPPWRIRRLPRLDSDPAQDTPSPTGRTKGGR